MSLEAYNGNLSDLVITNPTPTDPKSQGDDHLRGIKKTLVDTFGATTGPIYGPSGVRFPDATVQSSAAYNKTEADARYVNVAGDTMTGALALRGQTSPVTGVYALEQVLNVSLGASGSGTHFIDFANFSGVLVVNSFTSGAVGMFLCGGGGVSALTPSVAWDADLVVISNPGANGYTLRNNGATVIAVSVIAIRTRGAA